MSSTTSVPAFIQPQTFVALQLPSGTHKVTKLVPDTTIYLGKYGSFHANLLLGRPYYLTFEILDKAEDEPFAKLRVVPASELHAEATTDEPSPSESRDDPNQSDAVDEDGQVVLRNNRLTVDGPNRQALSMEEIEEMKKAGAGSGRELIAKIMQSHGALEEKTAFSLAKYTLRKSKKYLRRFTVLPLNVSTLTAWMLHEKEPARIMELREEVLGFVTAWSNVHSGASPASRSPEHGTIAPGHGKWLVVDDTSGLVVAAMAEKMGILYPRVPTQEEEDSSKAGSLGETAEFGREDQAGVVLTEETSNAGERKKEHVASTQDGNTSVTSGQNPHRHRRQPPDLMSAIDNTITLIHPASQPNLSILSYFSYDPTEITQAGPTPSSSHPLHTNLKTVSWLQLISPQHDNAYAEPEVISDEVLATVKAGKRGTYYRKRRRWERTKRVVDETRAGGFDGLVVASATAGTSVLHHLVPLLRGGAQVVVYSPNVEPLAELIDAYSSARRTAMLQALDDAAVNAAAGEDGHQAQNPLLDLPNEDFSLDPRLLLSTNLQTVRAREWQVLPGRTHPLMTSRGGAEGFVFTGTKVVPVEGRVAARGTFAKRRKVAESDAGKDNMAAAKGPKPAVGVEGTTSTGVNNSL